MKGVWRERDTARKRHCWLAFIDGKEKKRLALARHDLF